MTRRSEVEQIEDSPRIVERRRQSSKRIVMDSKQLWVARRDQLIVEGSRKRKRVNLSKQIRLSSNLSIQSSPKTVVIIRILTCTRVNELLLNPNSPSSSFTNERFSSSHRPHLALATSCTYTWLAVRLECFRATIKAPRVERGRGRSIQDEMKWWSREAAGLAWSSCVTSYRASWIDLEAINCEPEAFRESRGER